MPLTRIGTMLAVLAWLALAVAATTPPADAAGDNPFRAAGPAAQRDEGLVLPAPLRGLLSEVAQIQRQVYGRMALEIRRARETGSPIPALILLGLSFLYGVFHAIGPGHGKAVVAAYFAARPARLGSGIAMGGIVAFTQAASAILVVGLLAVALGFRHREIMRESLTLELISYALIILIGLYMAVDGGRDLLARRRGAAADTAVDPDRDMMPGLYRRLRGRRIGRMWSMGLAAGARPCSGSILVLLFTLANGVFVLGLLAALVMALGVGITISTLGMAAILTRRSVAVLPVGNARWRGLAHGVVSMTGALAIVALGGLMFAAAWQRGALFG